MSQKAETETSEFASVKSERASTLRPQFLYLYVLQDLDRQMGVHPPRSQS